MAMSCSRVSSTQYSLLTSWLFMIPVAAIGHSVGVKSGCVGFPTMNPQRPSEDLQSAPPGGFGRWGTYQGTRQKKMEPRWRPDPPVFLSALVPTAAPFALFKHQFTASAPGQTFLIGLEHSVGRIQGDSRLNGSASTLQLPGTR